MKRRNSKEQTVLILDDEENNLFSFQVAFKRSYNVLTAKNIEEAEAHFEKENIQVFISDERMPDGSGLEFIRKIRKDHPDTINMLMTAYDDISVVRNAINMGHVYYYITKPWDEDSLGLVLSKAFEKHYANLELRTKTEALEKAYYELDKLVYSASHDLRTPLSGILGLSELIKRELSPDQEEVLRYMDLMEVSTNRMLGVLDTLGEYSVLRAPNEGASSFDVVLTIKSLVNKCKSKCTNSNETVVSSVKYEGETIVHFNEKKLKLLLKKLIENAFQYKHLERTTHEVTVAVMHTSESLKIDIEDTGQGILPGRIEDIFSLFYRGSNQSEGIGMGLYLARELVRELNGTIHVSSKPGFGSKFSVEFPVTQ